MNATLDLVDMMEPAECRIVRCNPDSFSPDFLFYLMDNFRVWRQFKHEADRLWDSGVRHFGARCIWEHLRYETALRQKGGDYKLNDHQPPNLARLYMLVNPERKLFETRVQRDSSKRAA